MRREALLSDEKGKKHTDRRSNATTNTERSLPTIFCLDVEGEK